MIPYARGPINPGATRTNARSAPRQLPVNQPLGRRVLTVDMDLEAPGLSYLIEREKKGHGQSAGSEPNEPIFRRGVIELLTTCAESPGDWPLARRADAGRIVEYLTDLEVPATLIRAKRPGSLSILPAGRIDADYERRLSSIRWDQPPLGTQRDNLFRHLRNQVLAAGMFDYAIPMGRLRWLPKRIRFDPVSVSVWESAITIGNRRYEVVCVDQEGGI
jgi:hypothetical protein